MIGRLVAVLEWILSPPAWYRVESDLNELVTELHRLKTDMSAERERMAAELERMALDLERLAAEREQAVADLEQVADGSGLKLEQLGDMVFRHLRAAVASIRAPSTLSASKLTMPELQALLTTLKCMVAPVLDDVTTLDDLQESGQEFKWDPSTQASEVEGVIGYLNQWLTVPPGLDIINAINAQAANGGEAIIQSVYGLDFKIKGTNDVLLVPTQARNMAGQYALVGFKIKQTLTKEDLEQAQAEFVTWGLQSYSAYIQVVSDVRTGGVAYWLDPDSVLPDKQLIRMQVFAGMPKLFAFLRGALAALPESMLGFYGDGRRYEGTPSLCSEVLQQPKRCKFNDPGLESTAAKVDVMKKFFGRMGDDDAAEPDKALASWFPEGSSTSEPVSFPDHPS